MMITMIRFHKEIDAIYIYIYFLLLKHVATHTHNS